MPIDFISIFDKDYPEGKDKTKKIKYVCEQLNNGATFSQLDEETLNRLPAFSAWIAEKITTTPTQLRRFYTYVKGIEIERGVKLKKPDEELPPAIRAKLKFLLPKLAGSVAKKKQDGIKVLYDVFATCIQKNEKIKNVEDLRRFVEFFESILDYHSTIEHKANQDKEEE